MRKRNNRIPVASAADQAHQVLLTLFREREPEQHRRLCEAGRLAVLIGRSLGMSANELDDLRRAAELHDIGKLAIPEALLNKPGPLSGHEWQSIRGTPVVGERIIAAAPVLAPVATLVRSSQERWDGSGYPDRLAGEAIPLGARIVLVCDAFDAMTNPRPYERAKSPEEAISELRMGAGKQFDPMVVAALVEVWEESAPQ